MAKTKIVNKSAGDVDLREGQAGNFRKLAIIRVDGQLEVSTTVNATYKEYLCASVNDGRSQFILSSDDLNEWKEIKFKPVDDRIEWEGVTSRQKTATTPQVQTAVATSRCSIL